MPSLSDNNISRDKGTINLHHNPHTTFLCPSNVTVSAINSHVIAILFENDQPVCHVINAHKGPMSIYQDMTVVVTENR